MTAARVAAIVQEAGETVTLQRLTGTPPTVSAAATIKASFRQYRADQLVGPFVQGGAEVHIAAQEVIAAGWPAPPRKGDIVLRGTKQHRVEIAETRNYKADPALYILQCLG